MRGFIAFFKKECFELVRTNRLVIFVLLFILFGIMNPAIAKLTPKLFEMSEETLRSSGIVIGEVTVTAMDSWAQFVKNIPMAIIITLLMFGGIFTNEYAKGTLIQVVTKGLSRNAVVISKWLVMGIVWSLGFWMCFGITYGYTGWYWDNSDVQNLIWMAMCQWILGIFLLCCLTLFSAFFDTVSQVLLGVGGIYGIMYLLGMANTVGKYLPVYLANSTALMNGENSPEEYIAAVCITIGLSVAAIIISLPVMNKREL